MTIRRGGLGRGLEALIPGDTKKMSDLVQVPVEKIRANPEQPRRRFDQATLEEMAASIEEVGVLQPVVVRPGDDGFVLVAGERRWRAARMAGLATIPAVVRGEPEDPSLVEALVENVQREDLTPLEEAHAYRQLLEEYGMTQEEVASRVGKSRPSVANTLRLLQLPSEIQSLVDSGKLTAGHARPLIGLEDGAGAVRLAEQAVKEGWSVRQVEEAVRRGRQGRTGGRSRVHEVRPVEIIELEKRLADKLDTKVKIDYQRQKGKVVIRFGSVEDLERIYRIIG